MNIKHLSGYPVSVLILKAPLISDDGMYRPEIGGSSSI